MAREGRGLICLALTPERCDELGLDLMAAKNESPFETAFTVSIEARDGVTTGISAADRARTIAGRDRPRRRRRATSSSPATSSRSRPRPAACSSAPGRPRRRSTSRGSPGSRPAGVICEIMNDDGTMARVPDLEGYCAAPRAQDDHGRRPDRLPAPPRPARRARRRHAAPDRLRRVHRRRLPLARRRQAPRRARQGRGRRRRGRARARALRVPHRRRLPLAALRLRRAARVGAGDDRGGRAAACCSTSPRRAAGSGC